MTTYLVLLRGINVGAKTQIAMDDLRKLFEALGHRDVRTHLRTGNVVFTASGAGSAATMAKEIEKRVAEDLDVPSTVLVRTTGQLAKIVEGNPLAGGPRDPAKLHVTFLVDAPKADRIAKLDDLPAEGEEFSVAGREVYLHCPNGYGRTKLSNANLERRLGVAATTRTWRVVNTLHDLMRG
jgi:uncharacterized protein (DUF1697 family)